ncbi:hypothetical protein TNCT_404191 [Trichonephila clavata]|uniref:Uncharacterized protein n=1 Tax=Trichonephila clavata TaxID=2740835 RepID=A0A8X6LRZ7_TRICU|nr:hypothetical protein TNCT_404191 [Trichonephila clavata]
MEWFSNSACLLLNNTMPPTCPGQQDTFSEQKMHHHTTKQWLKLSMNILRTLTSNTGFHTTDGPWTSRHPYSFGNDTEKVLFSPSPATVDFVSNVQHTPCSDYKACFKPVNGPPKTFQDAMDPLRNKELSRTLIRKVLILKQAHFWDHGAQI